MRANRWGRVAAVVAGALLAACGGRESAPPAKTVEAPPPPASAAPAEPNACPSDGAWHECSVMKSLERAGLNVRRDSTPAHEAAIAQPGLSLHIGAAALEVFLFENEAARKAAESKLDTTQFVRYDQAQTIRAERSLIRAVNLIAILDSKKDAQRQRVGDALTAGPPQPPRP